MPYISNKRPKPKPPQNNVMTISKALKAVNDNMDWTVLFIALLLVMVQQGTVYRYPALLAVFFILFRNNRYAPDKQTINGILTVHKQSISVPRNKISNMGTRKNDKKLYILLYLITGK